MNLNEYIRRNYKTPNPQILSGLGASEELIAYLRYTPGNTNFNVSDSYCGGTEPIGEVWYTGTLGECEGNVVYAQLTETDKANLDDILTNYRDYSVSLNGTELPVAEDQSTDTSKTVYFTNADNTVGVLLDKDNEGVTGNLALANCPTDITNVEVTVTKK